VVQLLLLLFLPSAFFFLPPLPLGAVVEQECQRAAEGKNDE
jgi:hypothetical protein